MFIVNKKRTMCTYFNISMLSYTILKHLYLNHFCLFSSSLLMKGFKYLKASGFGLISSIGQPSEVFYKKGVLKNLAKFTGKHLRQIPFFNKVEEWIKKETLAQVFSCEFYKKILQNLFHRTPLDDCFCSSMKLDGRKDIQSGKLTWPFLTGNNKGRKTDIHTIRGLFKQ